jgi:hypothetical protein
VQKARCSIVPASSVLLPTSPTSPPFQKQSLLLLLDRRYIQDPKADPKDPKEQQFNSNYFSSTAAPQQNIDIHSARCIHRGSRRLVAREDTRPFEGNEESGRIALPITNFACTIKTNGYFPL